MNTQRNRLIVMSFFLGALFFCNIVVASQKKQRLSAHDSSHSLSAMLPSPADPIDVSSPTTYGSLSGSVNAQTIAVNNPVVSVTTETRVDTSQRSLFRVSSNTHVQNMVLNENLKKKHEASNKQSSKWLLRASCVLNVCLLGAITYVGIKEYNGCTEMDNRCGQAENAIVYCQSAFDSVGQTCNTTAQAVGDATQALMAIAQACWNKTKTE